MRLNLLSFSQVFLLIVLGLIGAFLGLRSSLVVIDCWSLFMLFKFLDYLTDNPGKISVFFSCEDVWIGFRVDRKGKSLYVCVIPTVVIKIKFS